MPCLEEARFFVYVLMNTPMKDRSFNYADSLKWWTAALAKMEGNR